MGGHLLHHWNLPEKRISKVDFLRLEREVIEKLSLVLPGMSIEPLIFFEEKNSFGDLDILVEIPKGNPNWPKIIEDSFGFKPFKNGEVYSFPVEGFQVDLILASSEVHNCALTYYAYESGNFMGRIANKIGMMYGHRGLYIKVPLNFIHPDLPDHQFKEILITRDPDVIFRTLGFDKARFNKGFATFEEFAQWVVDSTFFDPRIFDYESLNHINRTRNKKRPIYARFVELVKDIPAKEILVNKEEIRNILIAGSDYIAEEIVKAKISALKHQERKQKFNGTLIVKLRGLQGADLGNFIKSFKASFEPFESWLDLRSKEQVEQDILNYRTEIRANS